MSQDGFEKGLQKHRKVMGDEFVDGRDLRSMN